jgi:prophage antirepressor-like protein
MILQLLNNSDSCLVYFYTSRNKNMSNIKVFESKQVRTVWNEADETWYFVVSDVIQILTDTPNPSDYIKKMRKRDGELAKGWGQIVPPLWVETAGGKQRMGTTNPPLSPIRVTFPP